MASRHFQDKTRQFDLDVKIRREADDWPQPTDHHVELVLVVLDAQDHGHRLADLDDAGHLAGVRSFADLRRNFRKYVMGLVTEFFFCTNVIKLIIKESFVKVKTQNIQKVKANVRRVLFTSRSG